MRHRLISDRKVGRNVIGANVCEKKKENEKEQDELRQEKNGQCICAERRIAVERKPVITLVNLSDIFEGKRADIPGDGTLSIVARV